MTKLLTKSLFTTALECPRKLYYAVHGSEYDNTNSDDDFLRSLADGGIQVGALLATTINRNIARLAITISKQRTKRRYCL